MPSRDRLEGTGPVTQSRNGNFGDFPGDPVVKDPPCKGGDNSVSGWESKISRAREQLSPCTGNYWASKLWSLRATTREYMCRNQRSLVVQPRPSAAK